MSSEIAKRTEEFSKIEYLTHNLCYLMKKFDIDAVELARITGVASTTINGLKKGMGNPTLSTLQLISNFFDVSIGQLTENIIEDESLRSCLVKLPLLEMHEIQEFLSGNKTSKSKVAIEVGKNNDNLFAVKISNNSMMPLFEKGTIFVVSQTIRPQDGDVVLVQFNNQLPCFRKIFIEGESFIFSTISEIIGNEITKGQRFTIHGIVTRAIQQFHG